jgi:UDP-glucose 4-epimerase
MKAIVTGGAGFIGSNLVDKLVQQGHQVYVFDNLMTGLAENLNPSAPLYHIDVRSDLAADGPGVTELDGHPNVPYVVGEMGFVPDVIFHCAALARIQPSFNNPQETISINSGGTVRILDLARAVNARVVYAGSSSFYGDPNINPYSHSKWLGEEHCKMYNKVYGVPTAIARFFNVYGPKQVPEGSNAAVIGIFETHRKKNLPLPVTGTGEQRRDFTHVDDIVDGLIAMSQDKWNGEVFNLGSGTNHSIKEVAEMFRPVGIDYLPARPGEAWTTLADISFTKERLGWEPKKNISDYVEEFVRTL